MEKLINYDDITNIWSGYEGEVVFSDDMITAFSLISTRVPTYKIKFKKSGFLLQALLKLRPTSGLKMKDIRAIKFDVPEQVLKSIMVQYKVELKEIGIKTKESDSHLITLTVPIAVFRGILRLHTAAAPCSVTKPYTMIPNDFGINSLYELLTCIADTSYPRIILTKKSKFKGDLVLMYS